MAGQAQREPLAAVVVVLTIAVLATTVVSGHGSAYVAPVAGVLTILAFAHKRLLNFRTLLGLVVLTILFVPIKRYTLTSALPFNLELYRLLVGIVVAIWLTSLLIDRRVSFRRSGLEAPLLLFLAAIGLSIVSNLSRFSGLEAVSLKSITFFVSFVLVYFLIVSVVRLAKDIDFLVQLLAGGGALLGLLALFERATGSNPFNHMQTLLPFLQYHADLLPQNLSRFGHLRVYGPAQHPIALGAALCVLLPLAIYRAGAYHQKRWWFAAFLIVVGSLTTGSRTAILMLVTIVVVYVLLKPESMKRMWPALLPCVLAIHFAAPGVIGSVRDAFFPTQGLIAEQKNTRVGAGRLATAGPALDAEFKPHPFFGEGFGTRVTGFFQEPGQPPPNAPILDDGWLGMLIETGAFGAFCLTWLFLRTGRRMGRAAKDDDSPRGWLLGATTASIASFGVGMFTYDAFSFIQVTLLFFIVLAIGAAALLTRSEEWVRLRSAD